MIPRAMKLRTAVAAAALALPLRLEAQPPVTVAVGAAYEGYYFDDEDAVGVKGILLQSAPFALRARLPAALTLEVAGAYARGVLIERDDGRSDVQGFTDTSLRLARTWRDFRELDIPAGDV